MANISHFTQTVNGVSTTYDIHDANAVDLTSNQTVGGIKTFSNAPVVGSINLDGKTIDTDANGNMTYDSHIVDTIEEQGNGYIRYSNGIQICWGTVVATTQGILINFGKAFLDLVSYGISVCPSNDTNCWAGSRSATGILLLTGIGGGPQRRVDWTAIGTWK